MPPALPVVTDLGPLFLLGLDVEDRLSADVMRWAPPNEEPGLVFLKDGVGHGSRALTSTLWSRSLDESEVKLLFDDPDALSAGGQKQPGGRNEKQPF